VTVLIGRPNFHLRDGTGGRVFSRRSGVPTQSKYACDQATPLRKPK
jgi:hypothetical protein